FLRRTSTGCQFLQDDNLCNVHARFGMAAKPLMCRMFPHTFRATPTAVSVGMRLGECASAPATSLGLPVIEQHPELEQMLAEHDAIGLVPPSIWATPDRLISWEEYEAIETALFARSGDFVTAVFHAFNPGAQPGTGLERILERATLAGRQAQTLEPAALELEDRFCRGVVFGKDLFLHQDLAQAAALLVIKRELDLDATYNHLRAQTTITREQGAGLTEELKHVRTLDSVDLRLAIGLWHDLELHALAPLAIRDVQDWHQAGSTSTLATNTISP